MGEVRVHDLDRERTAEYLATGSIVEAIGGGAAVVLSILALANVMPTYLASIAAIALGVAMLFEGGAIASRYSKLLYEAAPDMSHLGSGMSAEVIGGVCGIVLGVLALIGLATVELLSIAAIVFGAAALFSSGATSRLNSLTVARHYGTERWTQQVATELVWAATGIGVLAGLAAIVLGILALIGTYPLTLSLVAFLAIGSCVLLSGASLGEKMMAMIHH
jgi:hypothetical protein